MKSWDKSSGKKRKVEVDHIKETKSSKFQGFAPAGNAANAVKTKFRRIEPESATKATPEKPAEAEAEPKATEKPADKPADDRQNTTREEPVGSEITPQDLAKELFRFIESTEKDKDKLVKAIKDKELETVQV
ncbi:hypothetical protein BS50DRAFT_574022 [Corynespora cassiicola Philippines]|uniref:Uncharacterized protein n=1 Tax=Corynespora cassiicola Philippines TaxID=1448308 RepID=A0A2T2NPG2_CORCC|nr:hypothetical protein BS50DRAFT_574022 [Corynespora cassiicola Philippines]